MAISRLSMLVVFATILLPNIAMAREFIVGDEQGWRAGVDYQAWAAGKTFWTGDVLVFNYAAGHDHVFKVNGTGFQSCTFPPVSEALSSGKDKIQLATPGRKWYIGDHCNLGQKLVITVLPAPFLPPTPAPAPAPHYRTWPKNIFTLFN